MKMERAAEEAPILKLTESEWAATCAQHGIGELPLAGPELPIG